MKIALVSDIHGNYKAYEAFLEYCDKNPMDYYFFIGDYITDCPYPERLLSLLYETIENKTCFYVKGNREEYLLQNANTPQGFQKSSGTGSLLYVAKRLTERDISFFQNCKSILHPKIEGLSGITMCHGIPENLRGNIGEHPELLEEAFRQAGTPFLFGGHSHKQERRQSGFGNYINPGSLGLAIDGVGKRAQFAVIEVKNGEIKEDFLSIPYDWQSLLKDFTESGIEEYGLVLTRSIKKTLLTGENYFIRCIRKAVQLSGKETAEIPEEIWEKAAKELEI